MTRLRIDIGIGPWQQKPFWARFKNGGRATLGAVFVMWSHPIPGNPRFELSLVTPRFHFNCRTREALSRKRLLKSALDRVIRPDHTGRTDSHLLPERHNPTEAPTFRNMALAIFH